MDKVLFSFTNSSMIQNILLLCNLPIITLWNRPGNGIDCYKEKWLPSKTLGDPTQLLQQTALSNSCYFLLSDKDVFFSTTALAKQCSHQAMFKQLALFLPPLNNQISICSVLGPNNLSCYYSFFTWNSVNPTWHFKFNWFFRKCNRS